MILNSSISLVLTRLLLQSAVNTVYLRRRHIVVDVAMVTPIAGRTYFMNEVVHSKL